MILNESDLHPSDFSMFSFTDTLLYNSTTHHSYDLAHSTNVHPYNSTTHFCNPNTYYSITPNTITISNYNTTYHPPSLYLPTNSYSSTNNLPNSNSHFSP